MWSDLKFALRQLIRHPVYTCVAAATLGLGMGACTTVFSALDAVLLRPLPYPEAQRLVHLHETLPEGSFNGVSGGVFLDWEEHASGFDGMALINPIRRVLSGAGEPERLAGLEVSRDFLRVLGLRPARGRAFLEGEDRAGAGQAVALVTEEAWRRRWGGAEDIVGSTVVLDGVAHTVVGVVPHGAFPRGILSPWAVEFVVPVRAQRATDGPFSRAEHWANVYGRLGRGVDLREAEARLKELRRRLDPEYPAYKRAWSVALQPVQDRVTAPARPVLVTLVAAVLAVMLIACANVANLMLIRAWTRQSEMAVRTALGAGGGRLLRQGLVESLAVAAVGGILGLAVSLMGLRGVAALASEMIGQEITPRLDWRVLTFAALLVVVVAVLSGLLPAWRMRRPDLGESLKSGGRSSTRRGQWQAQRMLVTAEVALTVVLLGATGLLLRSLANAVRVDPGFDPAQTIAFEVTIPESVYPTDESRFALSQRLRERIRAVPGVAAAGTGMGIPFRGGEFGERVGMGGQTGSDRDPIADINYVSPGYHQALGARLLAGRHLEEADDRTDSERVILINASTARRFFETDTPIDRRLSLLGNDWRIVGVVADIVDQRLDGPSRLCLYVPHRFNTARYSVVVRAHGDPAAVVSGLREAIRTVDARLPVSDVRTLSGALAGSLSPRRLMLSLVSGFGVTAVLLAALGLYGVLAYSVAMRRRELAIRIALGAPRRRVASAVVREALGFAVVGGLVGWGLSFGLQRVLAGQLFGVGTADPLVQAGTLVLVAVVAALAAWIPARRAASVDPVVALRND